MKTTIPLSRLAEILAAHGDISPSEASNFIRTFFDTIEQGLAADGKVTVKDFGSFTVTPDSSVSFQPMSAFSAKVNVAFDAFPVLEIDEDIKVDEILTPEATDEGPLSDPTLPVESKPIEQPKQEPVIPVSELTPIPTPTPEPMPELIDEPEETISEVVVVTDQVDEPSNQNNVIPQESTEEVSPVAESIVEDDYEDYEAAPRRCCTALWIIVATLLGLIAGIVLGYLGRHRIEAFLTSDQNTEPQAITAPVNESDTTDPAETLIDTSRVNLTEQDIAQINDPTTDPEKQNTDTIRYDVVSGNRFLTTMARQYYGHQDYWSYIYKANETKLRHPDRIRPGTRVVIPDFEKYRTSDDPEKNRNDAHRMGVEIYNRYK